MSMRFRFVALVVAATLGCTRSKGSGDVAQASGRGVDAAPAGATIPPSTAEAASARATLPPPPPPLPEPMPGRKPAPVEMRNVDLHITDDITLHLTPCPRPPSRAITSTGAAATSSSAS